MNVDTSCLNEKLEKLSNLKSKGKFQNYIDYIVFPYYKNLESFTRLNFDFPITILVGKNGSGKSSALQALYGTPQGKSPGFFWFSTELDPIEESGDRNRFFYGYTKKWNSDILEVRKSRILRSETSYKKQDPDYWETTRPSMKDGMIPVESGKRNPPVDKNVIYIDFRGELSAFDKYFYFGDSKNGKPQDYIRNRSKYLDNLFSTGNARFPGGHYMHENIINLNSATINKINTILSKDYSSIRILEHRIFNGWGTSILVSTDKIKYSDANAGSGEIAVIKLIYRVMNAKPFSLILLDEPEVSLHPSAQFKLKLFLIEECLNKKHQILISSHSPIFMENMPKESIKLFIPNSNNKFIVKENVHSREAFFSIEEHIRNKINIFCEDNIAKLILERISKKLNLEHFFNIQYIPGGAEAILGKHIPIYCTSDVLSNSYFILDGDKFYSPKIDIGQLTSNESSSVEFLSSSLKNLTNIDIKFYVDGSNGDSRQDQKINHIKKYIEYHYNNVFYFPKDTIPEQMILKSKFAESGDLFTPIIYKDIKPIEAKEHVLKISQKIFDSDDSNYYNSTMEILIAKWLQDENDDFEFIGNILKDILGKNS